MGRQDVSPALRGKIEALKDDNPELHRYIHGLETQAEMHRLQAKGQKKAAKTAARAGFWFFFGNNLNQATRTFTSALDHWRMRHPDADGNPRTFPTDEAGQVGAAVVQRLVRVSAVGLLAALLPTTLLIVQTTIMWQQNQLVQEQFNQQRRAQMLAILYDTAQDCLPTPDKPCPALASPRARAEAARGFIDVARTEDASVDLTAVDLSRVFMADSDLSKLTLDGANFTDAHLAGVDFQGSALRRTRFQGAELKDANLSGANLKHAQFKEALLGSADFTQCNLQHAVMKDADLSKANLKGSDLSQANLGQADLYKANLSGATLNETSFRSARLESATLRGARISGANFSGADLKKVDLQGAIYDKQTLWPPGFDPKDHGAKMKKR